MAGYGLSAIMVATWAAAPLAASGVDKRAGHSVIAISAPIAAVSAVRHAAMLAASFPRSAVDRKALQDAVIRFSVVQREAAPSDTLRVPVSRTVMVDLRPGDRRNAGEWVDPYRQRPCEPGSAIAARMSMRLDTGRGTKPAFGVGGIGGAVWRVTNALARR